MRTLNHVIDVNQTGLADLLAGFNEVNTLLQYFFAGVKPAPPSIKSGWYLRSLTEQYIPQERLK